MSNYRRLISYIYAYEGGIKGKNVGFAKLEVRNGQCKIQVNVRNVYIGSQDTGVYLLCGSQEILVGRIFIRNGAGEFRAVVSVGNVAGSGYSIDQCYGLTVHNLSDSWQCYTTIWEDAVAHAAEVVLEEATSDRVGKEAPVKEGSVAKAVEAEIEAQSRHEEKERAKSDSPKEELPSSVVPSSEPEDKEMESQLATDVGVMEIRPMEVLPIGKEFTAVDLNRGDRDEGVKDIPTTQEASEDMQKEPEEERKTLEPEQNETEGMLQGSKPVREKEEFMQEVKQTEPEQQVKQQSVPQYTAQDNGQTQQFRQNSWGQGGMLFPPNWFGRPNRPNRPTQQFGQPASGRQVHDMKMGQPGVQLQPGNHKQDPGIQPQSDAYRAEPGVQLQPDNYGPGSNIQPQPGNYQQKSLVQPRSDKCEQKLEEQSEEDHGADSDMQTQPAAPESTQSRTKPSTSQQSRPNQAKEPSGSISPEQNAADDEPKIDSVWQRFYKTYPKIQAFDYNGGCEILTIKPQDIGLLPRETWGYGNNSFLLHGYYNHRYLIFARLNNPNGRPRYLLGVPGHYYSNEKYMAAMFGFPNFVLSKVQPTGEDRFGYWYTDVRLGS